MMISESKAGARIYQGRDEICADCPFRSRCCQSEKGHARTINRAPLKITYFTRKLSETT